MELRQYFSVLRKWWWLILAATSVAGAAAFIGSLTTPRTYQSRTTLMVGQSLQSPNPNQADLSLGQALAASYADLVKREPVLHGALVGLGLNWNWGVLQNMVTSRVVPGTQLLEISVLDSDPERARAIADEIAQQLILQSPAGTDPQRDAQRQFVQKQIDNIQSNINQSQQDSLQLDDVIAKATSARQIQDARTRQAALQAQISTWQSTLAQLLTNQQQGVNNFLSIVEPASASYSPVSTGTASNVLLAGTIGMVLASGAAFVLEYLDDTLKTSDDVRHITELPTLGSIGNIVGAERADKLVADRSPRSPNAEAYRALRTNIQFSTIDHPLRTLMVTSSVPTEGKSLTAANLAIVLAQAGKRVILVDCDLRRPAIHYIFGLDNQAGLTTSLLYGPAHLSGVLRTVNVPDLKILTAGPLPPNPADLLGSQRMSNLIESLCNQADMVILDASPLLPVTDSQVLAALVDGVLLVVRAGHTRRVLVQRSRQVLKDIGVKVLGVVLNRSSERHAGYGSYYDYTDSEEPHVPSSSHVGSMAQLFKRMGRALRAPRAIPPAAKSVADHGQSDRA